MTKYTEFERLWNLVGHMTLEEVRDNGRIFTGFRIENAEENRYEAVCFKEEEDGRRGQHLYTMVVTLDADGEFVEGEREGRYACSLIESDIPRGVMTKFRRLLDLLYRSAFRNRG